MKAPTTPTPLQAKPRTVDQKRRRKLLRGTIRSTLGRGRKTDTEEKCLRQKVVMCNHRCGSANKYSQIMVEMTEL